MFEIFHFIIKKAIKDNTGIIERIAHIKTLFRISFIEKDLTKTLINNNIDTTNWIIVKIVIAELMTLVWNNLFSNAVKFTEPGGMIGIGLKREEDRVVVTVSDTGCGIAPEVGQHIFEKFYQGDTSHAAQGNGLGLALVKRVIDITGGEISVQSKLSEGTTFKVVLKAE